MENNKYIDKFDKFSDNDKLRKVTKALIDCMDWMESLRASTDAGFWDWNEDDAYTKAQAVLKELGIEKD